MADCRIIVEFRRTPQHDAYMRWERETDAQNVDAFQLLGRAFEIARRESDGDFHEALAAFFHGAMIQKEDVAELLLRLDDRGQIKSA